MTTATEPMSEESAFFAAMEANPECMVARLVFADWLAERGDVREMGYRALAIQRLEPWWFNGGKCWGFWSDREGIQQAVAQKHHLPNDWFDAVPTSRHVKFSGGYREIKHTQQNNPRYGVKVLLKAVVAGFLRLPPERQAELLSEAT